MCFASRRHAIFVCRCCGILRNRCDSIEAPGLSEWTNTHFVQNSSYPYGSRNLNVQLYLCFLLNFIFVAHYFSYDWWRETLVCLGEKSTGILHLLLQRLRKWIPDFIRKCKNADDLRRLLKSTPTLTTFIPFNAWANVIAHWTKVGNIQNNSRHTELQLRTFRIRTIYWKYGETIYIPMNEVSTNWTIWFEYLLQIMYTFLDEDAES